MTGRPPERDDLDALLDPLLPFAQDMLRTHGEFFPFGAAMRTDGEVELVAGYSGTEHPPSQDLIDLLIDGLRSRAAQGEIRAAGICYDGRIRDDDGKPTDAIAVALEHRTGDPVSVFMPYSRGRFSGWRFGALIGAPGERRMFEQT